MWDGVLWATANLFLILVPNIIGSQEAPFLESLSVLRSWMPSLPISQIKQSSFTLRILPKRFTNYTH